MYGWSLQQTANRINDLGIERPGEAVAADASLLGKWEKWPARSGRRPSPAVLRLLADLYDCGLDALLDLEDRRTMPPATSASCTPPRSRRQMREARPPRPRHMQRDKQQDPNSFERSRRNPPPGPSGPKPPTSATSRWNS